MPNRLLFTEHSALRFPERVAVAQTANAVVTHQVTHQTTLNADGSPTTTSTTTSRDASLGLTMKLDRYMRGKIRRRFDEAMRRGITPTVRGKGEQARLTYVMPLTSDPLGVRAALVLEDMGWIVTTILPKVEVVVVVEERESVEWPVPIQTQGTEEVIQ
jgi:hypothetical protein